MWNKTCQVNNRVIFKAYSMHSRNLKCKTYAGDVEYFAVYCASTGKVYLVPVNIADSMSVSLRLTPPKNKQQKKIRWAKMYEMSENAHENFVLNEEWKKNSSSDFSRVSEESAANDESEEVIITGESTELGA